MLTPSGSSSSSSGRKSWNISIIDEARSSIRDYQARNSDMYSSPLGGYDNIYSGSNDDYMDKTKKGSMKDLRDQVLRKRFGKATLNTNLRERAELWADELTIHGLPQAIKATHWGSRIFWFLIFAGACIGLIIELKELYINFKTQPTVINLQQTKMDHIELPEISICSSQPFNATKLTALGVNVDITDYMSMANDGRFNDSIDQIFTDDQLEIRRKMIYGKVDSWREFVDQFSIPCEEFFIRCQLGHRQFNCCDTFENLYTPDQGLCFRDFHKSEEYLKQEQPGVNGSLQVLIKTPRFMDYWTGGPRWNGITLGLPYFFDPHLVPVSKFMMMQIRPTHYVRDLNRLDNRCHKTDKLYARDAGCTNSVWNDAVRIVCGCLLYDKISNKTLCDPFTFLICQRDKFDDLMANYSALVDSDCQQKLCSEYSYEISVTYAEVNRAWIRSVTGEADDTYQYTLISLFYPDLMYTEIQEFEAVTFENIISSVGGLMGLWIGASVISFLQLVFYAVQFLYQRFYDWISGEDHT